MSFSNCTRAELERRKKELENLRTSKITQKEVKEMPKQILIDIHDPQNKLCQFGTLSTKNFNNCSRCGKKVICTHSQVDEEFKFIAHEKTCRTNNRCKYYQI
ncbi:hypothetical protein AAEX28_02475 [Lentisphaerota bacterium WC36G]|nr:hypothetical protein LJT99_05360 [Lentisphaerae bacterium WC36]